MKIFIKGLVKIVEDILDLNYGRGVYEPGQKREIIRAKVNMGVEVFRLFNCLTDKQTFKQYNGNYFKTLDNTMDLFFNEESKKQFAIPILDMTAYYRYSQNLLTHSQFEQVTRWTVPVMIKRFGDNWICSLGNEIKAAPKTFPYKPSKPGMAGQMEKLGVWTNHMTKLFISLGVQPENILVNVCDSRKYPNEPSTADMMAGKKGTNFGVGSVTSVGNVIMMYHRVHRPPNIREATTAPDGKSRLLDTAKVLKWWILSNDGNPADNVLSDGVDPSPTHKGTYKSPSKDQLFDTVLATCKLTKNGIRGRIQSVWFSDLGRDYVSHDIWYKCLKCGKTMKVYLICHEPRLKVCGCGGKLKFKRAEYITDWNYIDLKRSEVMAQAVMSVYGKAALPNRGKFPPIEKEKPIKGDPIEETKEIIIEKEVIMKLTLKEKIIKWFNANKKRPLFWVFLAWNLLAIKEFLEIIFWK